MTDYTFEGYDPATGEGRLVMAKIEFDEAGRLTVTSVVDCTDQGECIACDELTKLACKGCNAPVCADCVCHEGSCPVCTGEINP